MEEIHETVDALHPKCILQIGNPLNVSGSFFNSFSSPLWHNITLSCLDCVEWQEKHGAIPGLVTREWIEEMKIEHGEESPWYQIHVLGEFPMQTEASLFRRDWIDKAREIDPEDGEEDYSKVIATDVATSHGDNETVDCIRYSDTIKSLKGYKQKTTIENADRLGYLFVKEKAAFVTSDGDGVGEGLVDVLTDRRIPNIVFHGGYSHKAIDDKKYKNLRSQFYYILAQKLEKGMISLKLLPEKEFQILRNQLCSINKKFPDNFSRFQVESKEDMIGRKLKSPDYADALMMSEFAVWSAKAAETKAYCYR